MLKKINVLRRGLMRGLTKNLGHSRLPGDKPSAPRQDIRKILICRPNGRLGNLLLVTPLLQEVESAFPGSRVSLFIKGNLGPVIFKNYGNIDTVIGLPKKPFSHLLQYTGRWLLLKKEKYDIVINTIPNSSSGRLSTLFSRSAYKFFGENSGAIHARHADAVHMAKYPVYAFRDYMTMMGFPENNKPVPPLDLRLGSSETATGYDILRSLVKNDKETICLFTYATGAKCFPESWWKKFYKDLKSRYPDFNIIEILPVENVSQISFRAPSFYSRDIREIGSVIANTRLFIGADSGMMHLAGAVHIPVIGLFSVTNQYMYQPYGNGSMSVKVEDGDIDKCLGAVNKILMDEADIAGT